MPGRDVETVYALKDLFALMRPTSPTIYNVPTVAGEWTEIVSGLSDVAAWLLYNRDGNQLLYAFEDNPSDYRTLAAKAVLAEDTALTQLFVKTTTLDTIELEVWSFEKED